MGYGPFGQVFDEGQKIFDPGDALGMQREKEAAAELQKRYEQMRADYARYRPEAMQGRTNALNQQLGAFKPINDLLSRMYGPGAAFDLNAIGQNPMSYGMPQAPPPPAAPGAGDQGGGFDPLGEIEKLWAGLGIDNSPTGVGGAIAGASAGAVPGGLLGDPVGGALVGGYLGNQYAEAIDDPVQSTRPKPLAAGLGGDADEYARQAAANNPEASPPSTRRRVRPRRK